MNFYLKKLTKREKEKLDVMGWSALLCMAEAEREKTYTAFNAFEHLYPTYLKADTTDLYIIYSELDVELGRFAVSNEKNKQLHSTLDDIIIYSSYRKKGIFKAVLKILLRKYKKLKLNTSNKYLLQSKNNS